MAHESQGAEIKYNGETVGEVLNIGFQPVASAVIPVTHLTSPAAEKLIGVLDDGQIRLECNYLPSDAGQKECRTARRTKAKRYFITDFGTYALICYAYCSGFQVGQAVNQQMLCGILLEIDGEMANAVEMAVAWDTGIEWDTDVEWGEHWV